MLTPEYLQSTPNAILKQFHELEDDIIKDVARRINSTGKISATSNYQMNILYEQGTQNKPIKAYSKLEAELNKYGDDLQSILKQSAEYAVEYDRIMYEKATGKAVELAVTPFMENIIEAISRQSKTQIMTLSKTAGFVLDGTFVRNDDYLRELLNKAAFQLSTGAFTYEQIARRYIKELGDKGIRVFNFESGTTREMESHLKRIILDATRQLSNEISIANAEELGTDLMEISAHAGARSSHQKWQGRILSLSGAKGYLTLDGIGYGTVDGFGGANCRHSMYPYFEGARKMYPPRVRKEFENSSHDYKGKTYADYDATQRQRAMERGLRASKRRIEGLKAAGDVNGHSAELIRYRRKSAEYKKFSDAMNLKIRPDNLYIYRGPGKALDVPKIPVQAKPKLPKTPVKQYRVFTSGSELRNAMKISFDPWEKKILGTEKNAVVRYTGSSYIEINTTLRKNAGVLDHDTLKAYYQKEFSWYDEATILKRIEKTSKSAELTENAIDKFELPEPVKSYRVSSHRSFPGGTEMIGDIYTDNGFMSTTPVKGSFAARDEVLFELEVPEGAGWGAYVAPLSNYKSENEIILQRGTKILITDVKIDSSGRKHVFGTVVGNIRK